MMERSPAAASVCHFAETGCCNEPALILIKHCRDMKRQEMRLRLVTLLLLLTCSAFLIYTIYAGSWTHQNRSGPTSAAENEAVSSKQERLYLTDNTPTPTADKQKFNMQLSSLAQPNATGKVTLMWQGYGKDHYNTQMRAIVIPESATYFTFVRLDLLCPETFTPGFNRVHVVLKRWNEGYKGLPSLINTADGLTCKGEKHSEFRSVFLGEMFGLATGDHVYVTVHEGYELIRTARFGIHRV